mgnify:CR=1 FL=1
MDDVPYMDVPYIDVPYMDDVPYAAASPYMDVPYAAASVRCTRRGRTLDGIGRSTPILSTPVLPWTLANGFALQAAS